ncbi:MAG: TetR/AcrR family transcriptional regulator [Terriglobales bacterium]
MPRRPDPQLEERILHAARKLWRKGGEKALTMRAVAKAAGTNTPAVYRRFKNRQEILRALLRRLQREIAALLSPCRSPGEAAERYLQFALSDPHEYALFYAHAYQLPRPARSGVAPLREHRPSMALIEDLLAKQLGGTPADHTRLSLALWTLAHGTAMILIAKAIPNEHVAELRSVFTATVEALIRNASGLSVRNSGNYPLTSR